LFTRDGPARGAEPSPGPSSFQEVAVTMPAGRRARRAVVLAVSLMLALVSLGAVAQAANGPTARPRLVAPANHKSLARGSRPVFKVRDHGVSRHLGVYIAISSHHHLNRYGELKAGTGARGGTFTSTTRHKHDLFTYKVPHEDFPTWFMNTPGRYYWQAQHADCYRKGCVALSRIRTFRVR
jgi:hypothetical protein